MSHDLRSIEQLLERMWNDYVSMNPQARRVHELFAGRGERVVNDHIALRTFGFDLVSIDVLAAPFVAKGYLPRGDYEFPEKKLRAKHYELPSAGLPKIFISELDVERISEEGRSLLRRLLEQVEPSLPGREDFSTVGRPWSVSYRIYEQLRAESDYAAWVAAFGFRPNHFTVDVSSLRTFSSLQEVNAFLKANDFLLNDSGGEIKGSPEQLLEQSSLLANTVMVEFNDGAHRIPGCYYEFARRYRGPDGQLYQGFVAGSADKIFESTSRGQ